MLGHRTLSSGLLYQWTINQLHIRSVENLGAEERIRITSFLIKSVSGNQNCAFVNLNSRQLNQRHLRKCILIFICYLLFILLISEQRKQKSFYPQILIKLSYFKIIRVGLGVVMEVVCMKVVKLILVKPLYIKNKISYFKLSNNFSRKPSLSSFEITTLASQCCQIQTQNILLI